jgi:hypothetical protein
VGRGGRSRGDSPRTIASRRIPATRIQFPAALFRKWSHSGLHGFVHEQRFPVPPGPGGQRSRSVRHQVVGNNSGGSFSSAVPRRDRNSPFKEGIIGKDFSGAIGHAPETHSEHRAKTDRHRAAVTPAFARGRVAGRGQGASLIREGRKMDATRARRTRDRARQVWYARHRQQRFARFLGFTRAVPTECKASPSH